MSKTKLKTKVSAKELKAAVRSSKLVAELEAALRSIVEVGDGCMCDRPGRCGCGASAASIARETLRRINLTSL